MGERINSRGVRFQRENPCPGKKEGLGRFPEESEKKRYAQNEKPVRFQARPLAEKSRKGGAWHPPRK